MAVYGYAHTLNDMRKMQNADGSFDRVLEVLAQSNPVINDIPWAEGDLPIGNKTTVRASLPTPSIRRINRGVPATKGTTKQIIDVCMNLEDLSEVDVELLAGKANPQVYRASEDEAHLEGMSNYVASTLFYGNRTTDPDSFDGLAARYNTLTGDRGTVGYQTIPGGTANAEGKNTSMYIVDWGDRRVTGIYPRGTQAGFQKEDMGEYWSYDKSGNKFRVVGTKFNWKSGLAVEDVRSVVRVCNIDATKLASMTDSAQRTLMDKIIFAKNRIFAPKSPIIYVSDDMYSYLETYLMNKNNVHVTREDRMGAAPLLRLSGIPVKKCDCILETEAAVE
nr:MAG TPA: major capsid protein [Caudoviricetes sp.]